jgi:hypothetical protein
MLPFADRDQLLTRLTEEIRAERPLTFLCGSAISASPRDSGRPGVPMAGEIVDSVLDGFDPSGQLRARLSSLPPPQTAAARYQTAMHFVVGSYGQETLNGIVRNAVLRARVSGGQPLASLEELDRSGEGWELPPAVAALGEIMAKRPACFNVPLLTTNFDPLLELSIRRAGRSAVTMYLTADGRFDNLIAYDAAKIVHMHGYWIGSNTLHTPQQIEQPRPQLRSCLRELLTKSTLVVLGYGGWSDVFTRTLVDAVAEGRANFNVLWTFFSNDDGLIAHDHHELLAVANKFGGAGMAFYKGIDCHTFLPRLNDAVSAIAAVKTTTAVTQPQTAELVARDFPPSTTVWVGRENELRRLSMGTSRVIAITGIGGQGKSALAAKFLERSLSAGDCDFWDWRDCKEESHTLNTQLALIIQRLTASGVMPPALQGERTAYLIETLFAVLENRRALLVFDNTDQYVDVERARFVAGLDLLVARALKTGHSSTFVFTCRPHLEFLGDGYLSIPLAGLTRDDALRLFGLRGVPGVESESIRSKIDRVQELTDGHPLWMNVIATQVSQQSDRFDLFLERLEQDQNVGLPRNLLLEVWGELNIRQHKVLRYMAEMVTAENENSIAECISPDLNFNHVHRALRTLKSLDLVVTKAAANDEVLELHPLVRQFIRDEFPRHERVKYINPIRRFFERLFNQSAPKKGSNASTIHARYAVAKVELCLNAGDFETGAQDLLDIRGALIEHGHSDDFVRLAAPMLDGATLKDVAVYDRLVGGAVEILSDLGSFEEADLYLDRFEATIPGKTARYINLCNLQCYSLWCRREFGLAVEWGRRGDELKRSAGLDTESDCQHHLALARRDHGDIVQALEYFRHGLALTDVLAGDIPEHLLNNGPFWGNIGRCLQLQGVQQDAAACLVRSAIALRDFDSGVVLVNRGFAACWLGEVAEIQDDIQGAYVCFSAAREYWRRSSPPRSKEMTLRIEQLPVVREAVPAWRVERDYLSWLNGLRTPASGSSHTLRVEA